MESEETPTDMMPINKKFGDVPLPTVGLPSLTAKRPWWRRARVGERASAIIIGILIGIGDLYLNHRISERCIGVPSITCDLEAICFTAMGFGLFAIIAIAIESTITRETTNKLVTVTRERESLRINLERESLSLEEERGANQQLRADLQSKREECAKLQLSYARECEQNRNFDEIAPLFSNLIKDIWSFDSNVRTLNAVLFNHHLSKGSITLPDERAWKALNEQYEKLLLGICDTAVEVFHARKKSQESDSAKCCANIKIFEGNDVKNPIANSVCRSNSYMHNKRRRDDYDALKDAPITVASHYLYTEVLRQCDHVRKRRDRATDKDDIYCLVKDIDVIVKRIKEEPTLHQTYQEPRSNAGYRSCLIVPLMIWVDSGGEAGQGRPAGELGAIGLFCIDSEKADHFSPGQDLHMMKQLAYHAAMAIQSHRLLVRLQEIAR